MPYPDRFLPAGMDPARIVARIGLVSDTHMPDRCDALPPALFATLRGVDLLLHAGDVGELWVLDQLSAIAPADRGPWQRRHGRRAARTPLPPGAYHRRDQVRADPRPPPQPRRRNGLSRDRRLGAEARPLGVIRYERGHAAGRLRPHAHPDGARASGHPAGQPRRDHLRRSDLPSDAPYSRAPLRARRRGARHDPRRSRCAGGALISR